jgi:lipoprotein-releasing system ATP-binding protein
MDIIEAKNITKYYGDLQVLKGIDVMIKEKEVISIVGPSGSGKTTLLQIIGALSRPTTGSVIIDNVEVHKFNDKKMARFRNKNIGFVFQFHHLLPEFTALENVCIPAFIGNKSKKQTEEKAKELLQYLDIGRRLDHKPSELSGGEQQRVAVARALINDPKIVLADEPSGNLDTENKKHLHELFFYLRDKFGQTFVIVTHNAELAEMSDRKIVMRDGELTN